MTGSRIRGRAVGLALAALWALPAAASDVEMEPQTAESRAADPAAPDEEPAMAPESGMDEPAPPGEASSGWVERATFTTSVIEREPQDQVERLTNDFVEVFFFTELRGFEGETVTHRWEYDGEVVAEVPFDVGGPRWRTYSSKRLEPGWLGEWTASVLDASGGVMESQTFVYDEATATADAEAPQETSEVPAAPAP